MTGPTLQQLIVAPEADLRSVLQTIDANAQGIVFVVEESGRLAGVITDGDMRRAIVGGVALTSPASAIMNRSPKSSHVTAPSDAVLALLGRAGSGITHVPLVDDDDVVVDYASANRLHRIPIAAPELTGNELAYVVDCVKTGWISSQGQYVREFERQLGDYCGVSNSLAVSNGTVALHLALAALGVGPGDEVIVPDFTFAASINVIVHAGATPVIVDVDPETWTMSVAATAKAVTSRTKAIMAVHLYGQPCDLDGLRAIADAHGLYLVEDCAEALGCRYKGTRVGGFGDASAFSFFGNKTITTGEGGIVLFRDQAVADRARQLRDHGMSPARRYWHEVIGFNYRMTNLQAAIGVAQMERVESFLDRKRRLSRTYDESLSGIPGLLLKQAPAWSDSVCWLYTLLVTEHVGMSRDDLQMKLGQAGVETRPVFFPLHDMPPYRAFTGGRDFPVSAAIARQGLSLPSAVSLSDAEARTVVSAIRRILDVRRLIPVSS